MVIFNSWLFLFQLVSLLESLSGYDLQHVYHLVVVPHLWQLVQIVQ